MKRYIFAPHLDDEIIGCYSILEQIDLIIYFTKDDRCKSIINNNKYIHKSDFDFNTIDINDTIYLPCQYDYHPLHKHIRLKGLRLKCNKNFYSVDMNVPWLKEEQYPDKKANYLKEIYPTVDMKNDKYTLFKGIIENDIIEYNIIDLNRKFGLTYFTYRIYHDCEIYTNLKIDEELNSIDFKSDIEFLYYLQGRFNSNNIYIEKINANRQKIKLIK